MAKQQWHKTDVRGVRYRKHPTRKHGVQYDKYFVIRYTKEGRINEEAIGWNSEEWTLAKVAEIRTELLTNIKTGNGPLSFAEMKEEQDEVPTVKLFITKDYLERYAKKRKRTWKEDERQLKKDAIPEIGSKRLDKVTKKDIKRILNKVADRGAPIGANRMLAVLKKVFNYAVELDELAVSPVNGIKPLALENKLSRKLSDKEIKELFENLKKYNPVISAALRLLLLTAKRKGELIKAEWKHVDLEERLWTIPAANAKNKRSSVIPLNSMAISVLHELKELGDGSCFVCPTVGSRGGEHLGETSLDQFMRKNLTNLGLMEKATPHDLRRTANTILAKCRVLPDIRKNVLNHIDKSVEAEYYDQYDYLPEMRVAMDKLGNYVENVLNINEKSKIICIAA